MDTTSEAPMLDLAPATRQVAQLLDSLGADQLANPTPCPDYTVRDLLAHFVGLTAAFRDAATKELGPTTNTDPSASRPVLGDDWRTVLPRQLEELAAAWRALEAWQGMTQAGGVTLPAEVAGQVALNELVIHGWDLARATGQPYTQDRASLDASYAVLAPAADDPDSRGTLFGPVVEVPQDAPLLDRVIALSGRHPDWKPL
ncbi:TIGR03086 family metal-binding protein [Streptomyces sp. A3M-1-3]|uniref:TIGR03086 family metal-binding protein n=1 Tax=Streptomyces sp. A3M-1-3 TaxID=2962044 RepID=UPI0020B7FF4C|nr:TIGR03086 family metal-binding protein [Streptomyces sp. A3M-1-3]MCP3819223.1 TIGR03086 family metal-binding protein [Streptomyces sp. A3M-1-3]